MEGEVRERRDHILSPSPFVRLFLTLFEGLYTLVSPQSPPTHLFFFLLLSSGYISHTIPPFRPPLSSLLANFLSFHHPRHVSPPLNVTYLHPPFLLYSPSIFPCTPFTVLHRGFPGAPVFSPHPSFLLLFLAAVLLLSPLLSPPFLAFPVPALVKQCPHPPSIICRETPIGVTVCGGERICIWSEFKDCGCAFIALERGMTQIYERASAGLDPRKVESKLVFLQKMTHKRMPI